MLRPLVAAILLLCATQGHGASYETLVADYAPSLNGHSWPLLPSTAYTESTSNTWVHPTAPARFASVQEVHEADADFTTVVLRLPGGRVFKTYNSMVLGPYLAAVYSGDFNHDGVPDFMAIKPGSGCGLAAEYATAVFAFSEGADYRFTRVTMMGLGPHSLVLDPKTKTFRFMHTSLRQEKTADGRYHSFWVHRFFKWQYARFEQDADLQPVWVQYLTRPNHEPTKLLSPALRAKASPEDPEFDARIEW